MVGIDFPALPNATSFAYHSNTVLLLALCFGMLVLWQLRRTLGKAFACFWQHVQSWWRLFRHFPMPRVVCVVWKSQHTFHNPHASGANCLFCKLFPCFSRRVAQFQKQAVVQTCSFWQTTFLTMQWCVGAQTWQRAVVFYASGANCAKKESSKTELSILLGFELATSLRSLRRC